MVFSRRERIFLGATVLALLLLGLDRYALTPLLDGYNQAATWRESLEGEMAQAQSLLERRKLLSPRWSQMLADGLQNSPAEAESQALHAVQDWALQAGLNISSLKPERSRENAELREITLHTAGTGSMAAVSHFLWLLETAHIPIKVKMMQLGTRREGTDDLTLQLRLSTLYVANPVEAEGQEAGKS